MHLIDRITLTHNDKWQVYKGTLCTQITETNGYLNLGSI